MPQTVYDQGDPITSRVKLGVTPDGTTVVTVVVTRPDGTQQYSGAPSAGPVNGDEYTYQWTASQANDYVAVWTVTGAGAGVQAKVYNVRPLPTASNTRPAWAPFLSDVADYIPRLTIDMTSPGSAVEYGTFNGLTTPTDEQAMRLLDRAVGSVVAAAGVVQPGVYQQAGTAAALRTAAAIQRAYPRGADDRAAADALDRRADAELARLVAANAAAGATGATALVPAWAFPDPPAWGDKNL
jgi:hypothetical protein